VLSIDNSTLSILYPTFAFLLKLPRLQLAGDATAGGVPRGGGKEGASRNFLPAIAHRLTGNTSHKRGGAMPRFRVFVILASPRENFGPRLINGICSSPLSACFSHRERCSSIHIYILPYSTPHSHLLFDLDPLPSNVFDLLLIVRRGLLFTSMDNSLKLQKRFRRAVHRFSETIEFWI